MLEPGALKIDLDHIVYAVPDLAAACHAIFEATGSRPQAGGPHVGLGTRNALASLGPGRYLEIVAPDPEQPRELELGARLRALEGPELFHWALRVNDLGAMALALGRVGLEPTPPIATSRRRPDGRLLVWDLMGLPGMGGAWPLFIDWRDCPHPSEHAPRVGRIRHFAVSLPVDDPSALPFAGTDGVALSAGAPGLALVFESERGEIAWRHDAPRGFLG